MCEECQIRPATVHLTKIINGDKSQIHLCEECAKTKQIGLGTGLNLFGPEDGNFSIGKLLSCFFGPNNSDFNEVNDELKCDKCNLTFPRFTESGRFGCSHCYDAFKEQLNPMLRRIHGKTFHVGKVPKRAGNDIRLKQEINKLKRELQEAINAEEYERAAVLRDKIKELQERKA